MAQIEFLKHPGISGKQKRAASDVVFLKFWTEFQIGCATKKKNPTILIKTHYTIIVKMYFYPHTQTQALRYAFTVMQFK